MVRFGIFPNTQASSGGADHVRLMEHVIEEAQAAEAAGFDACFITEHHQVPEGYFPSPLVVAAAVAARTTRIGIGTAVHLLSLTHPVHVAEDAAMVDIISKGRLILGLGMGYQQVDFDAFGIPMQQRVSRFEEGLEVLRRCWTEDDVTFHGKRFSLAHVRVTPRPVQQPHPPIWIGAASPDAVKRAARIGDGWMTDPLQKLSVIASRAALYQEWCAKRGRTPHILVLREAWVSDSREQAIAEYGLAVVMTHRYYRRGGGYYIDVQTPEELTLDRIGLDRLIIGSPADCIQQIQAWQQATGAEFFALRFSHAEGPPHAQVLRAIERFGKAVLPHVR